MSSAPVSTAPPVSAPQSPPAQNQAAPDYPSPVYAWYVVTLLLVAYVFSFIDRQILALLAPRIQADLQISDSQMSYLMGFSFAVFYTVFGIPLGRVADSRSRRGLIAIGLIVWSVMSAGCGLAQRYWHLLLMRMGVGVGEATLSPAAYSLITDYFPPRRLGLAISLYGTGIYIGSGLAYVLGGYVLTFAMSQGGLVLPLVGEVRPWQLVFFIVGLPGVLFAGVIYTIREPIRRTVMRQGVALAYAPVPLRQVVRYVRDNWLCFFCHGFGFGMVAFVGYAYASWLPTFFDRVHGWAPGYTGIRYGVVVMTCGSLGILFGGYLADHMGARGRLDAKIRVSLYAILANLPLGIVFIMMPTAPLALLVLAGSTFLLAMPFGVAPAAVQQMMPGSMRGQASALYLFMVNLVGMGLGPSAVAWCTDYVFEDPVMIGYSLAIVGAGGSALAAILLGLGLRPFRKTLQYLEAWHTTAENIKV